MTLGQAHQLATQRGCELEYRPDTRSWMIRAIAYDADPYEISDAQLLLLTAEEFLNGWIPERL